MSKKLSFTRKNKTTYDKLNDLVKKNILVKPKIKLTKTGKKNKKGKLIVKKTFVYEKIKRMKANGKGFKVVKRKKFQKVGLKELAKNIGIPTKKLNSIIKNGKIDKKTEAKIKKYWSKQKFEKTKVETLEFENDALTRENFFKLKPIRKLKNRKEQYFFRMGIYIECKSNTNKNETYIIPNLPIPTDHNIQADNYEEGFWQVFESLKRTLQRYPSIKLWRVNYFDVHIIDISTGLLNRNKNSTVKYNTVLAGVNKKNKPKKITKKRLKALKEKFAND